MDTPRTIPIKRETAPRTLSLSSADSIAVPPLVPLLPPRPEMTFCAIDSHNNKKIYKFLLRHLAYRGTPAALPDLLTGRVPVYLASSAELSGATQDRRLTHSRYSGGEAVFDLARNPYSQRERRRCRRSRMVCLLCARPHARRNHSNVSERNCCGNPRNRNADEDPSFGLRADRNHSRGAQTASACSI
jgi:hypothetical protein